MIKRTLTTDKRMGSSLESFQFRVPFSVFLALSNCLVIFFPFSSFGNMTINLDGGLIMFDKLICRETNSQGSVKHSPRDCLKIRRSCFTTLSSCLE